MRLVFLLMFAIVPPSFSAVNTNSASGSTAPPSVKFKEWQIGRSEKGTDSSNTVHTSFITSTETTCLVKASVGYQGGSQPKNTSPINPDTVSWEFIELSHNMTLDANTVSKNWSGTHPSKFDTSTSFNVVAKLTVPPHKGTSKAHFPNYKGTDTPLNGRNDEPMTFKIKFTASTHAGQSVSAVLALVQDERDQMRQEYMDMARLTSLHKGKVDGNVLHVPARDDFSDENSYDDGHYTLMMDKDLAGKELAWEKACKKYAEEKLKRKNVTAFDVVETGGYRNPHHHYYHVPGGDKSPRSWHQFGVALDVRGRDIDI